MPCHDHCRTYAATSAHNEWEGATITSNDEEKKELVEKKTCWAKPESAEIAGYSGGPVPPQSQACLPTYVPTLVVKYLPTYLPT